MRNLFRPEAVAETIEIVGGEQMADAPDAPPATNFGGLVRWRTTSTPKFAVALQGRTKRLWPRHKQTSTSARFGKSHPRTKSHTFRSGGGPAQIHPL